MPRHAFTEQSVQPWHTKGIIRMRNYITTDHFDFSDVSIDVRHTPSVTNGKRPLELVRDDRRGEVRGWDDLPTKIVPPTSDFEGFGSFSG
ncbi:hypothetical protein [Methylobacterium sp. Leaf87]|uniref:hypothetical protein n=1 Tax=Methylobacterium sp. Leaf87 TaxID=1736243 RepID=UPI000A649E69|nr:hypothetical protein [Methylobacterium sp. Leaf87]